MQISLDKGDNGIKTVKDKVTLFRDDMISYIENPKEMSKNIKAIRFKACSKVQDTIYKKKKKKNPAVFLYTNNEQSENETKKTIIITKTS